MKLEVGIDNEEGMQCGMSLDAGYHYLATPVHKQIHAGARVSHVTT